MRYSSQQSRRAFLGSAGRLIVAVPIVGVLAGCEGDECGGAGAVATSATTLTVTSECANDHTHDFTIAEADLSQPPADGFADDTTPYEDDGHVHAVVLTMEELASIDAGQTVMKTTSVTSNHMHTFRFRTA